MNTIFLNIWFIYQIGIKSNKYVGNSVGNINNGNKKRSPVIDVTPYLYYGSFICLL